MSKPDWALLWYLPKNLGPNFWKTKRNLQTIALLTYRGLQNITIAKAVICVQLHIQCAFLSDHYGVTRGYEVDAIRLNALAVVQVDFFEQKVEVCLASWLNFAE